MVISGEQHISEMTTVFGLVEQIKEGRKERGLDIPEPIAQEDIEVYTNKFQEYFGQEPDQSFMEFIKSSDGLQDNGCWIYASKDYDVHGVEYGIIQNNQVWHDFEGYQKYIVYAESESLLFAYDKEEEKYLAFSQSGGRFSKSFSSCEEMLIYVMKLMLDEVE